MNHRRCWAKESGASVSASPPWRAFIGANSTASPRRRATSISVASPRIVGVMKSERTASSTARVRRTRETTCVASKEWPPRSKKLSSTPMRGCSKTSLQISASASSTGPEGATNSASACGAETSRVTRALRSTLPLAVRGKAGRMRLEVGIMYSGRRLASPSRNSTREGISASGSATR